jgi:hypothetical protein
MNHASTPDSRATLYERGRMYLGRGMNLFILSPRFLIAPIEI